MRYLFSDFYVFAALGVWFHWSGVLTLDLSSGSVFRCRLPRRRQRMHLRVLPL